MRYIDNDELELPNGWEARADKALNDLRDEVQRAENTVRAAGGDATKIAEARKNAITEGLKKANRQKIWKDLAGPLKALSNDNCWYSESKNPTADKDVDHFRPKNRVDEEADHEGYWWLAFDWKNYRFSSEWCNQLRNDKVNGTRGGKFDHFPLNAGSFRAKHEGDDHEQEEITLLDPIDPEDWQLLTFRSDGHPVPASDPGTVKHERAKISIIVYHLHCKELVDDRRPLAGKVKRLIQYMETLRPQITDPKMRSLYKKQEKELLRLIRKGAEYSAAALAYAKGEVFTTRIGQPLKRDWLEEILLSNS